MNCYNKKSQFLYNLILSSLVAITCSFLCSYPFWFSSLTSSIKHLVFISLPNICSSFLNPKCLFIVFNVIVAFLVGESKLLSSQSSPTTDIYSEYVERSQSLRGQRDFTTTLHEEKKEERKLEMDVNKESENRVYEDKEVVLVVEPNEEKHDEKLQEEEEEEEVEEEEKFEEAENNDDYDDQQEKDGEEESEGLPTEELNKRVEEFIARINKQRWLEARMLICSQA
ncbi:hypothetical protein TorRG33x02_124670 [Trema orientale]|uniref:DUF4408 domain-containing protein n=1 Tax=Trema orientale TaxID=63057 RepID=A0A2P5F280_TREOI|nr:hypothetical protein TorRG33x02_124670 [Trema orientale]